MKEHGEVAFPTQVHCCTCYCSWAVYCYFGSDVKVAGYVPRGKSLLQTVSYVFFAIKLFRLAASFVTFSHRCVTKRVGKSNRLGTPELLGTLARQAKSLSPFPQAFPADTQFLR